MRKLFSILILNLSVTSLLSSSSNRHLQTSPIETSPLLVQGEKELALELTQWSQGNKSTAEMEKTILGLNFDPTTVTEKRGVNLADHLRRKSSPWSVQFAACSTAFGAFLTGSFVAVADQYNDAYQLIPLFVGMGMAVPALIKYGISRWQVKRILNALKLKSQQPTA